MMLLAHHVESEHLPVLAVFLGVGIWVGWSLTSRLLRLLQKRRSVLEQPNR